MEMSDPCGTSLIEPCGTSLIDHILFGINIVLIVIVLPFVLVFPSAKPVRSVGNISLHPRAGAFIVTHIARVDCCHPLFGILFALISYFFVAWGVWNLPSCQSDPRLMTLIISCGQWMLLGFWVKGLLLEGNNVAFFMATPMPFLCWTWGPALAFFFWGILKPEAAELEKAWFAIVCCCMLVLFIFAVFTDRKLQHFKCSISLLVNVLLVFTLCGLIGSIKAMIDLSVKQIAILTSLRLIHLWTWVFGRMLFKLWETDTKRTCGVVNFTCSLPQLKDISQKHHVDLCYNRIQGEKLGEACEAMKKNPNLISVDFEANLIADNHVDHLRVLLKNNYTLQGMYLRGNLLTKAGASGVLSALLEQTILRNLAPRKTPQVNPDKKVTITRVELDPELQDEIEFAYALQEPKGVTDFAPALQRPELLASLLSKCVIGIRDPAHVLGHVFEEGTLDRVLLSTIIPSSGSTLLHDMVQKPTLKKLITAIEAKHRGILDSTKNQRGTSCYDWACADVMLELDAKLSFRGKFRPISLIPEHRSDTCVIFRATYGSNNVILKLMKNQEQFRNDVHSRKNLDKSLVVDVIWEDEGKDFEAEVKTVFGLSDYAYGFAMPAADRDLMTIFLKERLSHNEMGDLARALANALNHLHERGKQHGDLKPGNVVGFCNPADSKEPFSYTFKLIDFDACVHTGEPISKRTSTAYSPPEFFLNKGILKASFTFDLWSFGVILYRAYAHMPLIEADDRDNVRNSQAKKILVDWGPQAQGNALRLLSSAMRDDAVRSDALGPESDRRRLQVCDLLGHIFFKDPSKRLQTATDVLAHALLTEGGTLYMSQAHFQAGMGEEVQDFPSDDQNKDVLGRNPLHLAAENGHVTVVEKLLAKYPTLANNPDDNTPLQSLLHLIDTDASGEPHEKLLPLIQNQIDIVKKLSVKSDLTLTHKQTGKTTLTMGCDSLHPAVNFFFAKEVMPLRVLEALRTMTPFNTNEFNAAETSPGLEQAVWHLLESWALASSSGEAESKSKRNYLKHYIWPLAMWERNAEKKQNDGKEEKESRSQAMTEEELLQQKKNEPFKYLRDVLRVQKAKDLLETTYQIRDHMLATQPWGKMIEEVDSFGKNVHIDIGSAQTLLNHLDHPNVPETKQQIDQDVLVPFIRIMAADIQTKFEEILKECLDNTPVEKDPAAFEHLPYDWTRYLLIPPIKGIVRMKDKVKEKYNKPSLAGQWPIASTLGDSLRASVVCRNVEMVYKTWEALNYGLRVKEGGGRLKNNLRTAGRPGGESQPPDMLLNAMISVGNTSLAVEIQIHHFGILFTKETDLHLLYEIERADGIDALRVEKKVGFSEPADL